MDKMQEEINKILDNNIKGSFESILVDDNIEHIRKTIIYLRWLKARINELFESNKDEL